MSTDGRTKGVRQEGSCQCPSYVNKLAVEAMVSKLIDRQSVDMQQPMEQQTQHGLTKLVGSD